MAHAQLSVNVNKYALLRNARGTDTPNLITSINRCIAAGAQGITVHPRRDQRHIRFSDLPVVARHLADYHPHLELNIECENHPELIAQVRDVCPAQCTLVPVTPGEITSDHGWDLPRQAAELGPTVQALRDSGVRVSLFMDCLPSAVGRALEVGAHRVELYTGPFAQAFGTTEQAHQTALFTESAAAAVDAGLGLNAGHDLDRHNLSAIWDTPGLAEVSIGHALICRALEVGTATSIRELLAALAGKPLAESAD